MSQGLFKSIYGPTGKGLFYDLYNMQGQAQPRPIKSHNIRLGETSVTDIFNQDVMGIPVWLLSLSLLGFAYIYRKKKSANKA